MCECAKTSAEDGQRTGPAPRQSATIYRICCALGQVGKQENNISLARVHKRKAFFVASWYGPFNVDAVVVFVLERRHHALLARQRTVVDVG